MSLKVLKTGILNTLQDAGRVGYAQFGINRGGAMDWFAARTLNSLLQNEISEAVMELHFPAGDFQFMAKIRFALAGADFKATLNYKPIENNKIYIAEAGDVLSFLAKIKGERVYLAVAGGFAAASWLGSMSPNAAAAFDPLPQLEVGSEIPFKKEYTAGTSLFISNEVFPRQTNVIRFVAEDLCDYNIDDKCFKINLKSSRMGIRLDAEPILIEAPADNLSAAVAFGTIQLLPSGQVIILMADHQTSGGYPRLGTVIMADLPLLAQLSAHAVFKLKPCSIEEAEEAYFEQLSNLRKLQAGVALQVAMGF